MRYLDTGSRAPGETLAAWLMQNVDPHARELRFQSGYFGDDPLRLVTTDLTRIAQSGLVHAIVGSNNGRTTRNSMTALCAALALPNPRAKVRVVSFTSGLFHPKTYHVRRADGSQSAYVGSANLTLPGTTLNVEAGVALDTSAGDDPQLLASIAAAIDAWLPRGTADGVYQIASASDVTPLVTSGVLNVPVPPPAPRPAPVPPPPGPGGPAAAAQPGPPAAAAGAGVPPSPQYALGQLVPIPPPPPAPPSAAAPAPAGPPPAPAAPAPAVAAPAAAAPAAGAALQPGIVIAGYPAGVLFVSANPIGASTGAAALTGATPPNNAVGLIYAVQQAIVTKTFGGQGGTTDLNLPLDVLPLVRFGRFGANALPRAEFDFRVRYIAASGQEPVARTAGATNFMYYGVGPIASAKAGHRDIRMLIPSVARDLAAAVKAAPLPLPAVGNYVLLEFPTLAAPEVRLTILDPAGVLHGVVAGIAANTLNVGHGNAWWLPPGVSPVW